jgi:hypothetical protein
MLFITRQTRPSPTEPRHPFRLVMLGLAAAVTLSACAQTSGVGSPTSQYASAQNASAHYLPLSDQVPVLHEDMRYGANGP